VVANGALGVPVVAVVDELGPVDHELLELAASLGVNGGVQVWADDGHLIGPDEHARLTTEQFPSRTTSIHEVAVDTDAPGPLLDVAGPITAWG